MMNKDLEVKYHNGTITENEKTIFFKNMTQSEMWGFQDKVLNALWDKSFSSKSMANTAYDRIQMEWIKQHPSF